MPPSAVATATLARRAVGSPSDLVHRALLFSRSPRPQIFLSSHAVLANLPAADSLGAPRLPTISQSSYHHNDHHRHGVRLPAYPLPSPAASIRCHLQRSCQVSTPALRVSCALGHGINMAVPSALHGPRRKYYPRNVRTRVYHTQRAPLALSGVLSWSPLHRGGGLSSIALLHASPFRAKQSKPPRVPPCDGHAPFSPTSPQATSDVTVLWRSAVDHASVARTRSRPCGQCYCYIHIL